MEEPIGYGKIISVSNAKFEATFEKLDATFEKCDATFEKITEQLALFKSALQSFIKVRFDIDMNFDALIESSATSATQDQSDVEAHDVFNEMSTPISGEVFEVQQGSVVSSEEIIEDIDEEQDQQQRIVTEIKESTFENESHNMFDKMPALISTAVIEDRKVPIDIDGEECRSCSYSLGSKHHFSMELKEEKLHNGEIDDQLKDKSCPVIMDTPCSLLGVSLAVIKGIMSIKHGNTKFEMNKCLLESFPSAEFLESLVISKKIISNANGLVCEHGICRMFLSHGNCGTLIVARLLYDNSVMLLFDPGGSSFMVRSTHFLLSEVAYAYVHRVLLVNCEVWVSKGRVYEYKTGVMPLKSRIHGSLIPVYFSTVPGLIFSFDPGGCGFSFVFAEAATGLREVGSQFVMVKINAEGYTKAISSLGIKGVPNLFLLANETFQYYGGFPLKEIVICEVVPVIRGYTLTEPDEFFSKHFLLSTGVGSRPYLFFWELLLVPHIPYIGQFLYYNSRSGISIPVAGIKTSGTYHGAASIVVPFASLACGVFASPTPNFAVVIPIQKISARFFRLASTNVKVTPIIRFNYFNNLGDEENCLNGTRKAVHVFKIHDFDNSKFRPWFDGRDYYYAGPILPPDLPTDLQLSKLLKVWFIFYHPWGQGCFAGEGMDELRLYTVKVKFCLEAYLHDWTECSLGLIYQEMPLYLLFLPQIQGENTCNMIQL